MPTLHLDIEARLDGRMLTELGFPQHLALALSETEGATYDEPGDNNTTTFSPLPVQELDQLSVLILTVLQAAGIRLQGGESGSQALRLSPNGGVIAWGLTLADSNVTINVNSADPARVRILGGAT